MKILFCFGDGINIGLWEDPSYSWIRVDGTIDSMGDWIEVEFIHFITAFFFNGTFAYS